jgi:hypothetical protein
VVCWFFLEKRREKWQDIHKKHSGRRTPFNEHGSTFYVSAFLEETGVCKVEEYKLLDSQVLFKVRDSIFVQDIENKKPVCMPLSGALAGVLRRLQARSGNARSLSAKLKVKNYVFFR